LKLKLMLQLLRTLLFFKPVKVESRDILLLLDILLKQEMETFLDLLLLRNLKLINGSHGPTVNLSQLLELLYKLSSDLLRPLKLHTLKLITHLKHAQKL
jgi:hypothetical protein